MEESGIIREVFEKMKNNPDLAGSFERADDHIIWDLFDGHTVDNIHIDFIRESTGETVTSTDSGNIEEFYKNLEDTLNETIDESNYDDFSSDTEE